MKNKLRLTMKAAVATALLSATMLSEAANTNMNFNVSTTVNAICIIDSASSLTFASYDPSQVGAQSSSSTITVRCTNTTPFNIGLSAGAGPSATVATRVMTSGSNTLNYSLYQDVGATKVWGNTVGTDTVGGTGQGMAVGNAIQKTVYGQIPYQAGTVPGNYTDTVTVTVTY
jgi:spore coat protein U-like protein